MKTVLGRIDDCNGFALVVQFGVIAGRADTDAWDIVGVEREDGSVRFNLTEQEKSEHTVDLINHFAKYVNPECAVEIL